MKALKLENEALNSKQKGFKSKQKTNVCADEALSGLVRGLALTNKLVRDCTMDGEWNRVGEDNHQSTGTVTRRQAVTSLALKKNPGKKGLPFLNMIKRI